MRNSVKMTVPYQVWRVILTHMEAAGISFVFQTVAFWAFYDKGVFRLILGVLFTLIYAGFIYHIVRKLATLDYKDYTPMKPSMAKGVLFGAVISVITLALYIGWRCFWIYSSDATGLVGFGAIAYNFIFNLWIFPFFGLTGTTLGHIAVAGQIAMYGVPIAASIAGYAAAKNNIDLLELFQRSVYEKPEDLRNN